MHVTVASRLGAAMRRHDIFVVQAYCKAYCIPFRRGDRAGSLQLTCGGLPLEAQLVVHCTY